VDFAPAVAVVVAVVEECGEVFIDVGSGGELHLGDGAVGAVVEGDGEVEAKVVAESGALLGAELDAGDLIAFGGLVDGILVAVGDVVAVYGAALGKEEVRGGEPCVVGDGAHVGGGEAGELFLADDGVGGKWLVLGRGTAALGGFAAVANVFHAELVAVVVAGGLILEDEVGVLLVVAVAVVDVAHHGGHRGGRMLQGGELDMGIEQGALRHVAGLDGVAFVLGKPLVFLGGIEETAMLGIP